MFSNRSVDVHQFSMIPRAEIPRSSFRMQRAYKTAFGGWGASGSGQSSDFAYLHPIFVEEVLPGDTWNCRMTAFCRLATPIFPTMDNLYLDSHFFFVPNRLVWLNWDRFMGERRPNTDSSIDYLIPQVESPVGGFVLGSIYDYMGLPIAPLTDAAEVISVNALPLRAYTLIWNEWFRDQNLVNEAPVSVGDGPDASTSYVLLARGKRHDYFTSCLPFPQKGDAVSLPLGTSAPVIPGSPNVGPSFDLSGGSLMNTLLYANATAGNVSTVSGWTAPPSDDSLIWNAPNLVADLSAATAATINQLRQSFQIQRLLERDARGGTRYTEIIRAHFGVISPDARLQRPEYLGGGTAPITISPVAQTSGTSVTGSDTPQGNLAAIGTGLMRNHGFTQSFTEHGYVIGLVSVRADLTYQRGIRRHWSRSTRYDFYFPVFAMLGEQAVLQKEIFATGVDLVDNAVFGYQERWAEYRYLPSEITSLFRSLIPGTLDAWHYSQAFVLPPFLNSAFIQEAPPIRRNTAVGGDADGAQFLFDAFFDIRAARPLPMYSVPGMIDHF